MMNNPIFKVVLASVSLFAVHVFLFSVLFPVFDILSICKIHLFLGLLTIVLVFLLDKLRAKNQIRFGQAYLASVVLKMFASVAFLAPFIFGKNEGEKIFVIHFFAAFFIYLFLEVYLLVSQLKK